MILGTTINDDSMVIVTDTKPYTIKKGSHARYDDILAALKVDDFETAEPLLDQAELIQEFGDGALVVTGNEVSYRDRILHGTIVTQIFRLIKEDFAVSSLISFLDNLYENPSFSAVNELYDFISTCNLTITPDGHFLAYKYVTLDYKDCYTQTFDNSIGAKPEMKRCDVDDNRDNECSEGLHFCSKEYLLKVGRNVRWMIVKVNPADVVSVPSDYNFNKGRCWQYEVVGEIDNENLTEQAANEALNSAVDTKYTMGLAALLGGQDAEADDAKRLRWKKGKAKMRNPRPEIHNFSSQQETIDYLDRYSQVYD